MALNTCNNNDDDIILVMIMLGMPRFGLAEDDWHKIITTRRVKHYNYFQSSLLLHAFCTELSPDVQSPSLNSKGQTESYNNDHLISAQNPGW